MRRWRPSAAGASHWRWVRGMVAALDPVCRCACRCSSPSTDAAHVVRLGTRVPGGRYNQKAPHNQPDLVAGMCASCHRSADEGGARGHALPPAERLAEVRGRACR